MNSRYEHYQRLRISMPARGVLKIEMNRPERLNAADDRMHHELGTIWRDADADPDVAACLVTGVGKAFCAGGDMKEIVQANIEDSAARFRHWKGASDLVYNMINCTKPIVSAVRGPAAGAGLSVALMADISIVSRAAKLVDGHTRLGVAAGDHAAIIWPLLCGMAKAKYYLLTCDVLTGEEAERIGLVSKAVDDDELDSASLEAATRLAQGAPTAVRWTKYALNNWLRMAGPIFDTSLALEFMGFSGPEVKEGLASHLEKRAPVFNMPSPF
jgi:enoyl-CoA hydratase